VSCRGEEGQWRPGFIRGGGAEWEEVLPMNPHKNNKEEYSGKCKCQTKESKETSKKEEWGRQPLESSN